MGNIATKYIVLCTMVIVFAASTSIILHLLATASEPGVVSGTDKSLLESTGVQEGYEQELTGYDVLLSLLNTDTMTPYPRAIKINDSPVLKLDASFLTNQIPSVAIVYNTGGQYQLGNMLEWKVVSHEYVYDDGDTPYIHFILEDRP